MPENITRPYVILKSCMSLDGFIDDNSDQRLLLSNQQDFEQADQMRASADAILVGAGTIRNDNPKLLVRSEELLKQRLLKGLPLQPLKVSLTNSGNLNPDSNFFTTGDNEKLIYCPDNIAPLLTAELKGRATIVNLGTKVALDNLLQDLNQRGVKRLLVEAGSKIASAFLASDFVDELQISIAPCFLGSNGGARLVNHAELLANQKRMFSLICLERFGDHVLLVYGKGA